MKKKMISLIRLAIALRIIRFMESPHGQEVVCCIGDYWFYFAEEYIEMEEFRKRSITEQAEMVYKALAHNGDFGISDDEVNYYMAVIQDSMRLMPKANHRKRHN